MTNEPPAMLDGADVQLVARIGPTRHPTGAVWHTGIDLGPIAGLAIARYDRSPEVYLFYCDQEWNVITDTRHDSVGQAIAQAESEFTDVRFITPR